MSYAGINFDTNIILSWSVQVPGIVIGDLNNMNPADNGFTVNLPNASIVGVGQPVQFNNISPNDYILNDYDGNFLFRVDSGVVIQVYVTDTSSRAGLWTIVPLASGTNAIVQLIAASSDGSVRIGNGTITPPGGTIDFTLSQGLQNLIALDKFGILVVQEIAPLTFGTVALTQGNNITITNPNGLTPTGDLANPTINLSATVTNLTSLNVGNTTLTGSNIITATDTPLNINGVTIDNSGNITANSITSTNSIVFPGIASAAIRFYDNGLLIDNPVITAELNIENLAGGGGSYVITLPTGLASDGNYLVLGTLFGGASQPAPTRWEVLTTSSTDFTIITTDNNGNLLPCTAGISVAVFIL